MKDEEILRNEQRLGKFLDNERTRNIAYLTKRYSCSEEEANDIYQESSLAMFKNVQNGKLVSLTAKLSTYLTRICINQALKVKRDTKSMDSLDDEVYDSIKLEELLGVDYEWRGQQDNRQGAVARIDPSFFNRRYSEVQERGMEEIINIMPHPCNRILWSYYYDNLSFTEIAKLINFKNSDVVKAKKWQCISELKKRFGDKIKDLMYD